ncbi:hypothetical protein AB4129_04385 [Vibrio cyclitrophicus]
MLDNKYIKHPYNCEKCNALTPHLPITKPDDSASEMKQFKFGILIEFLMTTLFKSDSHSSSFFVEEEQQYECEKCNTTSWH